MKKTVFFFIAALLVLASCSKKEDSKANQPTASGLLPSRFNSIVNDKDTTHLYAMKNAKGMEVCVTNIGARIVSILVPDKNGIMQDVVLGFDNIESYKPTTNNFGAVIGRYANLIAGAAFQLNRVNYELRKNNGKNTIHGGPGGFHSRYFTIQQPDSLTLECTYLSENTEEGFPGNLNVKVVYKLTNDNALDISYSATTDFATVVNLTSHSYFNLSGDPNNTILDHTLFIDADQYTPVNEGMIPTGKFEKIKGTPLDFSVSTAVGSHINDSSFVAIKYGKGYDLNYVLNKPGDIQNMACKLVCPSTGIKMEVYTTEPGVQLYTGNFLNGSNTGKKGTAYQYRTALCLETQHFPDSPNQPNFPSTVLNKDETYSSRSIYKFGIE